MCNLLPRGSNLRLLLFVLIAVPPWWAWGLSVTESYQKLQENGDHLGLRVYIRQRISGIRKNPDEWNQVWRLIVNHPEVGLDVIRAWPKLRPRKMKKSKSERWFRKRERSANRAMVKGKYDKAFKIFQGMAKKLKGKQNHPEFRFLYDQNLHFMARALYSSGHYNLSTEVYNWIPNRYPFYRQVLFEKMWSAFREGDLSQALGAVAAQRSSYFSQYLEPEAYLILLYAYRRLCREEDFKKVQNMVEQFSKAIADGSYDYREWARSSYLTQVLLRLSEADPNAGEIVGASARKKEQEKIKKKLKKEFSYVKKRLAKHLKRVKAFSALALSGRGGVLKKMTRLPSRAESLAQDLEMWPVSDAEDWVDEIGGHAFFGESLCGDAPQ